MEIRVKELDRDNVGDINQADGTFTVKSILRLEAVDGLITYRIDEVAPYKKRYLDEGHDYGDYLEDPDRTGFLAYADGELAGQVMLKEYWNNLAYIDDIRTDRKFRQVGIGKRLIAAARSWAQSRELAGIMLETQNNNVAACKFYESCGFTLGGFDRLLYRGLDPEGDEIAIFWYMLF